MLRVILSHANGRILRDEQFVPVDEDDMRKTLNRAIRAAMREPSRPGEPLEFRLTILRHS